ncbi:hypothetical protein TspCOW1_29800 [Thiohalobacter sp. COW1]|uniref:hypothetical protein n=1 Tax=Thiohalobacter sp. COW1 TaxID=2795687 RepID=UPI0019156FC6|nr:hypothetical protein [Thiohalobacter sp. COW1]BCO32877.1 hypothetical protein TspCOW1_29800 [Thiohalobacter sp. COW1]
MANDNTCGQCTQRVRGWCKTRQAKVGARLRACREFREKSTGLPVEQVRELLEAGGVAGEVISLDALPDGQRGLRLVAGLDPVTRSRIYEVAGIRLVPVQPVAVSEPEPPQEAPTRQAGGRAA